MIKPTDNIDNNTETSDNINNTETIVKLKRGRKSKKELLIINEQKYLKELELKDNITCSIEETFENKIAEPLLIDDNNIIVCLDKNTDIQQNVTKKRGRKPKGGKIIQQIIPLNNNMDPKPNVILHLKCSLKDLQTNTLLSSNVESFNFSSCKGDLSYEIIGSDDNTDFKDIVTLDNDSKYYEDDIMSTHNEDTNSNKEYETKEIWKKLKQLEHNLHVNNISDKKSD